MKIALCTIHTPNFASFAKYTTMNFRSYCNIHGYDFIECKEILDPNREPQWSKIKLIQKYLDKYEWIMWIDSDAAITNKNIRIESLIDPKYDIILSKEDVCNHIINTGTFIVKNSEWSKSFLEKWYAQEQFIRNGADTYSFLHLYDNNEEIRSHIKVVKQKIMNSYPVMSWREGTFSDGDFVNHFAGIYNPSERNMLRKMAYYGDQNYVSSRDKIPGLSVRLGLNGSGIEIGVRDGAYAECILENSQLSKLYLCDPWRYLDDYKDVCNTNDETRENDFIRTKERLIRFKDRIEILRMLSEDASKLFSDSSLDFVYIDANHDYKYVLNDIQNWYPKVRKGGMIAGHDFTDDDTITGQIGVRRAVTEFFKNAQCVYITDEDWPSWYVLK